MRISDQIIVYIYISDTDIYIYIYIYIFIHTYIYIYININPRMLFEVYPGIENHVYVYFLYMYKLLAFQLYYI